jgi:formylglycine-generating enzyme required for sulfatase activity
MLDTVYSYSAIIGTPGNGCTDLNELLIDFNKHGYRLPTSAEWEYACKAGLNNTYFWGESDDLITINMYAWCLNNDNITHVVATKLPNAFGLYDMAGNVGEWCNDWYGNYTSDTEIDPFGPNMSPENYRVLRGGFHMGSYDTQDPYRDLRSANRYDFNPAERLPSIGFRGSLRY